MCVEGTWDRAQAQFHINRLELLAVELSLHHFVDRLQGKVVLVRSDNTTTCAYINRQGGTRSWELCAQACRLWLWCIQHQIAIRAVYIPGPDNVPADALSRGRILHMVNLRPDQREWSLPREVVQSLFLRMGEPVVDLFATRVNAKLHQFCSIYPDQGEMARDSLSIPWGRLDGYAFPPFALLPFIVNKVITDEASILLIAPNWPARSWFTALLHLLVMPPVALPDREDLLSQRGQFHPSPQVFKLVAWRISGNPSAVQEFRKRLSLSQPSPWVPVQGRSMQRSGQPSLIGVVDGMSIPLMSL
jgi:hypothetical protein